MKRNILSLLLLATMLVAVASGFSNRGSKDSLTKAANVSAGRLQVYVMDVGRGQSVLVVSPKGKAVLIDGGPTEAGSRVVSELRRRGVQNLELAIATQAGADYIGGMRRVVSSSDIFIKNFIDSAQPWKTDAYQQMLASIKGANITVTPARRGQFFDIGGARLDILNPAGDGTWAEPANGMSRENENSVVVRILCGEFAMLIMSGAGAPTAEQLLAAGQNIWAPFLLVGDQGSPSSTSEKMLSIVQPKFAIISSNGAPASETIERLRAAKAEIYSTSTSGEITITSDGKKHEITTERKSAELRTLMRLDEREASH